MLRAIALALSLMLSLGAVIPLLTGSAEAGPRHHHKKKRKKFKKYSHAWWRNYHQKQRQMRVLAARKRALQLRREMLANQSTTNGGNQTALNMAGKGNQQNAFGSDSAAMLPSGETAPRGWQRAQDNKNELQFRVQDDGGTPIGSAQLSVIGPASGADSDNFRSKTVGGISTAALRRTVIDRMMKEDGWVVNDYQKDVNGKKVYVVVAQSKGANGQTQSRLFYFTEVEGKIYSLATNSPNDASERLAQESEKVINSLQQQPANRPVQAGLR